MNIAFLNVRSIYKKIPFILDFILSDNIKIFGLCETWLTPSISDHELFISNFKQHRLDRFAKKGGGILILVSTQYSSYTENTLMCDHIELVHISIENVNSSPLQLVTIYRPPNSSFKDFQRSLTDFLNNVNYGKLPFIIQGDFNIDSLNKTPCSKNLLRTLSDYGLKLINHSPTRTNLKSSTQIDLIFSNDIAFAKINLVKTISICYSDHNALIYNYKKLRNKYTRSMKNVVNFTDSSCQSFVQNIRNLCLYSDNVDDMVDYFLNYVDVSVCSSFSSKTISFKENAHNVRWFSKEVKAVARKRDYFFSIAKQTSSAMYFRIAKFWRNQCNYALRKSKRDYFNTLSNKLGGTLVWSGKLFRVFCLINEEHQKTMLWNMMARFLQIRILSLIYLIIILLNPQWTW